MAVIHMIKHGVYAFHCPGCGENHAIADGWNFNGNYKKPTIMPSIMARTRGGICHLFVKDGRAQFLTDCTHSLAGHTVDLPDWGK